MNLSPVGRSLPETAFEPGPDLYPWDIGPAVAEAQDLLYAHGFQDIAINGDFDWKTEAAVKAYQRQHQLRVDGIIGAQTWISLKQTVQPGVRSLQEGHAGADVYELQGLLQIHGHAIQRDGIFGPETRSAVLSFQHEHHLQADGIVMPVTWALLGEKGTLFHRRRKRLLVS